MPIPGNELPYRMASRGPIGSGQDWSGPLSNLQSASHEQKKETAGHYWRAVTSSDLKECGADFRPARSTSRKSLLAGCLGGAGLVALCLASCAIERVSKRTCCPPRPGLRVPRLVFPISPRRTTRLRTLAQTAPTHVTSQVLRSCTFDVHSAVARTQQI